MESTPVTLLERLRQPGDVVAWERFVHLCTPLLYHWLRGAGLQEADAADLVQDVLTTLVTRMPDFVLSRDGSFHAWLRTVAMNRWRDLVKRKALIQPACDGYADNLVVDPLESFIERDYRGQLALHALRIMKADFNATTYQTVWDLVVEGIPAETVARKHGLTVGAVYAAKCRVLARLRQELQGLWV